MHWCLLYYAKPQPISVIGREFALTNHLPGCPSLTDSEVKRKESMVVDIEESK